MNDVTNDSSTATAGGEGSQQTTGGSQEFVPPKDGSWIPRERVTEMVQQAVSAATGTLGREVSELRGRLEAQTEQLRNVNAQPKVTAAQLRARVEAGEMSEAEMQDVLFDQRMHEMENRVVTAVTTKTAEQQRATLVTEQVEAYKAKVPAIMTDGTPERSRVLTEYNYLVNTLGMPKTNQTELQAIRTVLGPVESIGAKADGTPEHHQEMSGSGGGEQSRDGHKTGDGAPAHLSPDERNYYQDLIKKGIVKDWKEAEAELKHASPHLRKRMGAKL